MRFRDLDVDLCRLVFILNIVIIFIFRLVLIDLVPDGYIGEKSCVKLELSKSQYVTAEMSRYRDWDYVVE